jgi:hypothetical protein
VTPLFSLHLDILNAAVESGEAAAVTKAKKMFAACMDTGTPLGDKSVTSGMTISCVENTI